MCGITGFFSLDAHPPVDAERLAAMTRTLVHRGPDDEGMRTFRGDGFHAGLGHRRLSILDLSPAGRCPMANEDETVWITYNGEIYDTFDRRSSLERDGHRFRSRTDTEILLHEYEESGDATPGVVLHSSHGMFAFGLLDLKRSRLLLARDHLGKKPLFWTIVPGTRTLLFASEVKALLAGLPSTPPVSIDGLDQLLTFGYIPAPDTLLEGIHALPPGHTLVFDRSGTPVISSYWRPNDYLFERCQGCPEVDDRCWEEEFLVQFERSVRARMVADVPVGAFLSGGIDSGLVVAAMARASDRPVKTYTIGFDHPEFDEREPARRVAQHLGTEHRECIVRPGDVGETLHTIVRHTDEGFADSSALPTYFVSRLAREEVKVVLSGDGGDELFAGYTHYLGESVARHFDRLPLPLRMILPGFAAGLARVPGVPGRGKLRRVARVLQDSGVNMAERFYRKRSLLRDPDRLALYRPEIAARLTGRPRAVVKGFHREVEACDDFVRQIAIMDLRFYLPHDMLMKVDHASMACALEVRTPFLDHELVQFALGMPTRTKLRGMTTKVLLRRLARRLLPAGIAERNKQGFGVPLSAWFRDDLGAFARGRLLAPEARIRAFLQPAAVGALLARHQAGRADLGQGMWTLLCVETWLREFGGA